MNRTPRPQVQGDGWGIMAHDHMLNNHRDHLGFRHAMPAPTVA